MLKVSHLILIIQDDAEDLGSVSLLNASPSGDSEDIVVLCGVVLLGQGLLWEMKN